MSEKIKTAVMEIIKAHMQGEDKNTKAVLSDVMESVNELETLEQEPCDDMTSREAVLDALLDYWHDIQFVDGSGYDVYEDCKAVIDELPSVTQKSETVTEFADRCRECGKMRKGHWIYDETIENWRCSKCNETPKTMGYVGTDDFMAEHFKFCNHCGAKMESEDKE